MLSVNAEIMSAFVLFVDFLSRYAPVFEVEPGRAGKAQKT